MGKPKFEPLDDCDCDGWKDSMEQISNAQFMSELHHGAPYTGWQFIWCPWCGKKRQLNDQTARAS